MNIINKIIFAASSLSVAAAVVYSVINVNKLKKVILSDDFTVTAHTGCEKTKDNSLDAVTVGFGYGADIVEFDLFFNNAGVPVLSHNEPVGGENTLEEAFALISQYSDLRVNIDVKCTDNLSSVLMLAEKYGLTDRIFYTGITKEFVDAVKAATPDVQYYLNVDIDKSRNEDDEYIKELIDDVISLGAIGLNVNYTSCTKKMVDAFHSNGLLVSVWTVNKKSDMPKALALGSDNITTRYPSQLIPLVEYVKKS